MEHTQIKEMPRGLDTISWTFTIRVCVGVIFKSEWEMRYWRFCEETTPLFRPVLGCKRCWREDMVHERVLLE